MKNIPEIRIKGFFGGWKESLLEDNFDNSIKTNTWARIFLSDTKGEVLNIHYGDILIKFGSILDLSNVNVPHIYNSKISDYNNFLQNGDVVFADTAEDETAGKAIEIANIQNKKLVSGLHTIACHPKREFGNGFWGYYLNSPAFHSKIISLLQGIKVLSLSKSKLAKVEVNIPKEISEQQSIGTFFQNLDNLITEQKNKLENLQKVKKSMLCKMFPRAGQKVPEIRFKEFKGNWELITLGNVGLFHSNGVDKKVYPNEHMVNLLNYMDIYNCRIVNKRNCNSLMQVSANDRQLRDCNVLANDIFFTPSSETVEDVGHIMVIEEDLPNTCYSYHLMRFRPYKGVFYSSFPNYGFQTSFVRHQMRLMANGVQRFVLGKTEFESLQVLIPSYDEQKKIAKYFTSIETQITFQTQRLKKLKQIKSACLQKMFV